MSTHRCDFPGCTSDGSTELGHVGTDEKRWVCDDHYGLVPYPKPGIVLTPAEAVWVGKVTKLALDTNAWHPYDPVIAVVRGLHGKVSGLPSG